LIGNTPLVKFNRMVEGGAEVYGKVEYFNPGGSVKDRIGLSMIEDAEKRGLIAKGSTIVEPTSGNTGIGLALVAAVKGYRLILTMPEGMSLERGGILSSLGAEIIMTPAHEAMAGAVRKAEEILAANPDYYMPQQFNNPANPAVHRLTTAIEIWEGMGGRIDAFVAAVGTGGTITGVGEVLKDKNPNVHIVAVEPKGSPVLSGGQAGPHKIQGIGAGFIPRVLNVSILDEIVQVSDRDAYETSRRLAVEEGLLGGISSGASVYAALQVAKRMKRGRIAVVLPDSRERYFSIEKYLQG
jgi:cysteine synthase A